MGCGSSTEGGKVQPAAPAKVKNAPKERKQSVMAPVPVINVTYGANVETAPPKVIFVFGGPGSGKGRVVACLQSMFGLKLISSEAIVLKYLPKKVAHVMTISSTEEIAELVKKEPHHVTLDWVLRLVQHVIESDPNQIFIVDIVPNLKWLIRDENLIKDCTKELENFENKIPISFALHLSLNEDSLNKTLDYSHHTASLPPGATVADEADNSRAKRRFQMHEKAVLPFLDYFKAGERVVTVDVSSGATEAIWDKVHEVFTALHLQAWRPVNSVLVFAMEGLKVGGMDLSDCGMQLIRMSEITTEPEASVETLLGMLSEHIDTLADASHYFVIDPSSTTLQQATISDFHKRAIVFSDIRGHGDKAEGCVNKFSIRLNSLAGGGKPYFKAVCSSDDETLVFPSSCDDMFCQQMALCMAELHPSKR